MRGVLIYLGIGAVLAIFVALAKDAWAEAMEIVQEHGLASEWDTDALLPWAMILVFLAWPWCLWILWQQREAEADDEL